MFSFNTDRVDFDEEVGEGGHGTVYGYQQKHEGDDTYVVKRVMTPQIDTLITTVQEIVLGFSCDHPHVLPIKGYHLSYNKKDKFWDIFIKMPRMQTSLKARIDEYARQGKTFKEEDIVRHFYSLTLGMRYLHSRQIAHRDIKPDNILVDKNDNLKIADVGIAKLVEDESTELLTRALGTSLYTAPEVLTCPSKLKKRDLFMADIWSLGLIMAELCVPKTRLVNTKTTGKANESMLAETLRGFQGRYNKVLLELISSLLRAEPNERKSLEEVQRVLEETYPHILAQNNKNKEHRVEEENESLKSRLSELQKQVQDLHTQLETLRLFPIENQKGNNKIESSNNQYNPSLANLSSKLLEEEKKSEEKEPNRGLFNGNCMKVLEGHTATVTCLTLISPSILASGSQDSKIKFWDTKTGTCLKTLQGHDKSVWGLQVLSSDELASCSWDKTIKVWDIKTGKCLKTLKGHTVFINCIELLPGDQLASGSSDETIKIWNLKTYSCVATWKTGQGAVWCLKFLPMRSLLASGHPNGEVKLWDIRTGTCSTILTGHYNTVYCLQMLPSGELATGSDDKTIKLWDLNTGKCLKTLTGHADSVRWFEILSTGELVSCSDDRTIKTWDTKKGAYIKSLQVRGGGVLCLQMLLTGELASGSEDGTIKLWS